MPKNDNNPTSIRLNDEDTAILAALTQQLGFSKSQVVSHALRYLLSESDAVYGTVTLIPDPRVHSLLAVMTAKKGGKK